MTPDDYLGRVRATAWWAAEYVPQSRLDEVYELIEHGEPAEGLCTLAWAIVRERVFVPGGLIEAIRELTAHIVDAAHMPSDLEEFGKEEIS
jgi:hypothetical protein